MSRFFISRPIFASVISIVIVIAGLMASLTLPVAQYPEITPPTLIISATFPGANADTLSKTVAAPIEEQLSGVEGLIYYNSTSNSAGVVTITGGKLTTYREMAADTVDEVIEAVLARRSGFAGYGDSTTRDLALRGAAGHDTVHDAAEVYPEVSTEHLNHLADRYGGEARVLMASIQSDPTLAEPLVDGLPYVKAEAIFAVRHEMARSVDDVLSRRTRARLLARDDSADAADSVAALIAEELGWDDADAAASADDYRESVAHERDAAGLPETHLDRLLGA